MHSSSRERDDQMKRDEYIRAYAAQYQTNPDFRERKKEIQRQYTARHIDELKEKWREEYHTANANRPRRTYNRTPPEIVEKVSDPESLTGEYIEAIISAAKKRGSKTLAKQYESQK